MGVDQSEVKLEETNDGYLFRTPNRNEKFAAQVCDIIAIKEFVNRPA